MKIKAVCEATALTDRTVRYYIDEGLLFPDYAENYLGRKTFDFSQADIDRLKEISVLRRFGFSISEIREMIQHPEQILPISEQLCLRKQNTIDEERQLLQSLTRLNPDFPYTLSKLAECLSESIEKQRSPIEDKHWDFSDFFGNICSMIGSFLLVWLPILLSICTLSYFEYPIFSTRYILLTLLSLLPSFSLLVLPRIHLSENLKETLRRLLRVLCIFSLFISPLLSIGIVRGSQTTDFRNYRKFDADCIINRDDAFHALFPQWVDYFDEVLYNGKYKTVYFEDAQYYYHYSIPWEYKYDVYVQVPLKKEQFDKEVARVSTLFESRFSNPLFSPEYWDYLVMEKGAYKLLILYQGTEPFVPRDNYPNGYDYYIFAYDEKNLLVRYICCTSIEGYENIPYYMELEW